MANDANGLNAPHRSLDAHTYTQLTHAFCGGGVLWHLTSSGAP